MTAKDLSILIIDDERVARDNLRLIIEKFCPGFTVAGEAANVPEGLKSIKKLNPDIVLLDIEMPGGNGFELLDYAGIRDFQLIFITAYNQYAIRAFKYYALDYLLKPVDIQELVNALKRAAELKKKQSTGNPCLKSLFDEALKGKPEKIAVHTQSETEFISISAIIRLEAAGSYTDIFLKGRRKITASRPMGDYAEILLDEPFCRVHNSHMVQMKFVQKYIKKDGYSLLMEDGSVVPVAVRRREVFEEMLKRFVR